MNQIKVDERFIVHKNGLYIKYIFCGLIKYVA